MRYLLVPVDGYELYPPIGKWLNSGIGLQRKRCIQYGAPIAVTVRRNISSAPGKADTQGGFGAVNHRKTEIESVAENR